MKKILFSLLFALPVVSLFGQGVNFQDLTIEQAVAKAKAEHKYVFVDVYTDWCGPCQMMNNQLFPMKEMGDYFNPKFISVKMNAEKGDQGPAFANKYSIKAYPTFVILDGNNELVHLFAGGVLDLTFIDKVEESFDPSKAFGALQKRYDAGERDTRFVASYLGAVQNSFTQKDIEKTVKEFFAANKGPALVCKETLFMFYNYASPGSEMETFLVENRDAFRRAAGTEEVDKVFKMQYMSYFNRVMNGYIPDVTVETIQKLGENLATYGIADDEMMPVYTAAAIAKLSGTGVDDVFEMAKSAAAKLSNNDKDTMLYVVTLGLKTKWTKEQSNSLVALVTNESTKGYIVRSLGQ